MSDTLASLRHKISGADDLESVVRSMKALAAASIGQYEKSVLALADYYRTVELGLVVCIKKQNRAGAQQGRPRPATKSVHVIVFGSDQGLVGQFNDSLAEFAAQRLQALEGEKRVWAVGERIHARLGDAGLTPAGLFAVPTSVHAIAPLVGQILLASEAHLDKREIDRLYLFHNCPKSGAAYEPVCQQLLPLDEKWRDGLAHLAWPTKNLPEIIGSQEQALHALVGEYLFVSLYKACAESLASENASRLAAMQRAEKNIDELVENLNRTFRRLRQTSIDAELFDVLSGYESLSKWSSKAPGTLSRITTPQRLRVNTVTDLTNVKAALRLEQVGSNAVAGTKEE
jgi:F-type H+-transporting ATPase subunit gamma